ncbi:ABC transporter ATP-binding protein [Streptomyces netropsis]|uniref:ATP-binding cassette subfamily B protein n=1 Tax=Streptomyces netropsis TaxID=55404 RepID=A0A7W7PH64_STRNE|nr:ABC transporter ATP-binding protein [Streptomyces netropsis]MBB4890721.1 ATP-binding cassette subfamily B protein [Streptomyces netropsis]GGR51263.1 multidrug ABC transporter permease [Streptomyces netropsis]
MSRPAENTSTTVGAGTEEGSPSERLLFGGPLLHDTGWNKHERAYLEMSLWAMASSLPRLVASTVRLAWRADRRALWAVGCAEVLHGVTQAIGLVAVNEVLGAVLATGPIADRLHAAVPALIWVAVTSLVGALAMSASTAGTGRLEPKVERVATEMYLERVIRVELEAIEDEDFHRLLDSAQYGAAGARRMIRYCTAVVGALVSFAAAAGVLTVLHPALLPLLLLMTLPRSWAALRNSRTRYESFQRWAQHARAGRLLSQTLIRTDPAPEIRVHDVGPFLLGHFRSMSESSEGEQTRLARSAAKTRLIASALTGIATLVTYLALGGLLLTGVMALSVAGTAVLATRSGAASLTTLILQVNSLYEEACYVMDLERLCVEAHKRAIPVGGLPVPDQPRLIRFEDVTFTYPGDSGDSGTRRPALSGVTLDIPMGKIVALVGENGSGKTTLVKLLAGLYQPGEGAIRWDGQDAGALDRADLFSRFAMVSQDFHRWPLTARMNIAIGRTDGPLEEERVEAAARYAGARKVVEEMPRGWDTLLSRGYKGGHQISGGQWQKLGLARAHYRDAQILIVDEPTSALDARAELEVFEQIRQLAQAGQTVLLITHRLASVRDADLIHVLEKGRLRESGTFEELTDNPPVGIFRDLYEMQRRQFVDEQAAALPGQRKPADADATETSREL